ncbi:MAG TPA: glycosyltransferase family 39 protein [Anaerolineales bacterium]|nr:glycosyltransferase family 39 protein [Anaerolineales bacterium]
MLLLCLPALVLFLIFLLAGRQRQGPWRWRASVMLSLLAWAVLLTIVTELLSLLQKLAATGLAVGWTVILVALLGVLAWLAHRTDFRLPPFARWRSDLRRWIREQGWFNWTLFALLALQTLALVIVAVSYAPNAFESMRYHLPRVMHWLQDGSLASFASSNVRENYFPPFAEYVFLHVIALTGGDLYVNLVQVVAFLLCLIAVSAVAQQLGVGRNARIAAAALAAGIPLAVLQATSPRNDLIVAAWLLLLVWFGLRWAAEPTSWLWPAATGLSLGLALLTKATAFVFAFPVCVVIGVAVLRGGGVRPGLSRAFFVLILALALNAGHVVRNWALYGSPGGAWGRVGAQSTTPATVASTAIRNVALHVPTDCQAPLNFLDGPGKLVLRGLEALHSITGQDPIDPGTTWGIQNIFEGSPGCSYDEQEGGNALHALIIFLTALTLPFLRSVRSTAKWLALALITGFLLLSLFVRWQIWGAYLQLPLFFLWAPILAWTLDQVRGLAVLRGLALLTILVSFIWIYNNALRPLSRLIDGSVPPRDEQYFSYHPMAAFIYPQYRSVARLVAGSGCERVGLRINSPILEYPFWVLLREQGFKGEIEHVDVGNELAIYEDPRFVPCAVISEDGNYSHAANLTQQQVGPFYLYLDQARALPDSPH